MNAIIHTSEKIIGLIILATILLKIGLISFFMSVDDMFTVVITSIFFISAVIGIIGMIKGKIWGYIGCYIFIPTSTFLGISAVPFILNIVPYDYKSLAVITLSVIMLIATITLHVFKTAVKNKSEANNLMERNAE
jgi:hypothetical protein